ncbi:MULTISPECIES: 50S ribosomal protein L4 [Limnobacter]|uniref:Large ribosomal subunit protein uL4 n=1 Tax=Limnobacter litoralis TaxID=481366 RepID=A0ABQ5YN74_9BURK|nr:MULTISPECIES: 50S ribosomal protein L4 [Limnobacter]GLR25559.1 50S ribosomal protein L4 [Limnobacter litoralis]HEX5484498.1 50S ribosomal protein L4 [Limnobacter sp.]
MELKLINDSGQSSQTVQVSDVVFGREYNEPLIHQLVVAYQANARQGTRAQKGRADVKHSTRKPWKQKGTGRARAGMSSSPLWRGGGKTFPNLADENFTQKLNKKMYRAGICSILSQLGREERLVVVDSLNLEAPKTKLLNDKIKSLGFESVLVVVEDFNENLYLASRNLPHVAVVEPRYVDPLSLIHFKKIVVTRAAVEKLQEMFA